MKKPLWFTFGNHMHWVDMQWLWGYQVLPDCIDDMLALCSSVGARGNVNFDGVGYEKLASEAPEALARLREAVTSGVVEIVGASYGQPYGLFCGGESNVRQRVVGARVVRRLFGVWPRSFWEEEFDFYPQLPQILSGCGFSGASLFFQWTWHTPHIPEEEAPIVHWEGIDGTRLPAAARTALCLHQWPEDFDGKLDLAAEVERPAVQQWIELLPSPDWMCRSEVLLPKLRELFADERFDVRPSTLSELVEALDTDDAPVRRYTMDDVFHGVSLGKNGDRVRRLNRCAEEQLLAAESAAALAGLFGRPYASWHVYPTWELEESWRELLQAQHHDIDECEGLCGSVGVRSYERSIGLSHDVLERTAQAWARRAVPPGESVVINPLGWTRGVSGAAPDTDAIPPFGHAVAVSSAAPAFVREESEQFVLERRGLRVHIDRARGTIEQIYSKDFPDGALAAPLLDLQMMVGGETLGFTEVEMVESASGVSLRRRGPAGEILVAIDVCDDPLCVHVGLTTERPLERPDPAMHAGLRLPIEPGFAYGRLLTDTPYAVDEIRAERDHVRKYPSGDWMTSEQFFETIRRPFTAWSLVDFDAGDRGLLHVHSGSQAFLRTERGIDNLLSMYDAWDGEAWIGDLDCELWLLPHGRLRHADRWRLAQECRRPPLTVTNTERLGRDSVVDLPPRLGALDVEPSNVIATAFFRESAKAAEHLDRPFAGAVSDPHIVRLVEFDGAATDVVLRVPGPCVRAARTNMLGAIVDELDPSPCDAPPWAPPASTWNALHLTLRPREIATVMLDLEPGRHQPRNLDEHRQVWATVHRHGDNR